jgi:hypothetical protein
VFEQRDLLYSQPLSLLFVLSIKSVCEGLFKIVSLCTFKRVFHIGIHSQNGEFWMENLKGRDNAENVGVGRLMLCMVNRIWGCVLIDLTQGRIQWQELVNTLVSL